MKLEERFNKAIDDRNFNVLEITGFAKEPRLALLAGAAIGYQLGLDDYQPILDEIGANIKKAIELAEKLEKSAK